MGASAKFSPPIKPPLHCYTVCRMQYQHHTQLHGLITDRSVEFTFSPLKVSENSGGGDYWPRGGRLKSV